MIPFTGERIVPEATNCEPLFAQKMYCEHLARYAFAAQFVRNKKVLDIGCGVGYGAAYLADSGAKEVVAFDISDEAIKHACAYYSRPNVSFNVGVATDFDFGQDFEIVTCFELIEHVDDPRKILQGAGQAILPGGRLLVSTPRRLEQKRSKFHTREFDFSEFQALIKEYFCSCRFFFENNHFCSLIAETGPSSLENIILINDQFAIQQADYFLAVARKGSVEEQADFSAKSTLVVGDDKYVKLLERDIDILKADLARLTEQLADRTRVDAP